MAKKRNKKYMKKDQAEVLAKALNAFNRTISDHLPLDDDFIEEISTSSREALDRITTEFAPKLEDVNCIKVSIEAAMHLCMTNSTGRNHIGILEDALLVIKTCVYRHGKLGKYGFNGDELRIIDEALDFHDALINISSNKDVRLMKDFLTKFEYMPTVGRDLHAAV